MAIIEEIKALYETAKEKDLDISEVIVSPAMESTMRKIIEEQNLSLKVLISPQIRVWNIEEYKKQPFKDATIADYWHTFDRRTRREIERQVKKGKNPDIVNYL